MNSWLRSVRRWFESAPQARVSEGYQIISATAARNVPLSSPGSGGWHLSAVASRQDEAYTRLLAEMRAGRARKDLAAAAEAVRQTGIIAPAILEVGCGSGYYADVIAHLTQQKIRYVGLDYSAAMIRLARREHPSHRFLIGDGAALPFQSAKFDVVLNGVSLMHIMRFEAAVAESRRLTRRWCIFHTVPLVRRRPTTYLQKQAYGAPVLEVVFNEEEFRGLLAQQGLLVRSALESIPYDLAAVLGEPSWTSTFVCETSS